MLLDELTAAKITVSRISRSVFSLSNLCIFGYLKQTVTLSFVLFGELVCYGWAVLKRRWPPPSQNSVADAF